MKNSANLVYQKSITKLFTFLKNKNNIRDAYLNSITVQDEGLLLPFCKCHLRNNSLITKIQNWEIGIDSHGYDDELSQKEFTKKWLEYITINTDDSLLFLCVDDFGEVIGSLGFKNCHNEENLMQVFLLAENNKTLNSSFFAKAFELMIEWARKTINCNGFFIESLVTDQDIISFYKKNGFDEEISFDKSKTLKLLHSSVTKAGDEMILTAGPSISQIESFYCYDAAKNGWNSSWAKYLNQFEEEFAQYVDAKYALATSSCTGALQIALMALDIGVGDEVVVPDQTWVATANAVRYVGATPVFADVELDSWNLDASSVESLITDKTKAIMPVHMYGHPARMTKILEVAHKYNLKIVEDAAPAIGAEWEGQRCGSFGDFAGFSFQGAKLLVTGEGGMLVTSDEQLFIKAKKIWDQGRNPNSLRAFWIDSEGVKFKMSNVQAAVGLGQLQRADELIEMKRRIFSWYEEELGDLDCVRLNREVEGARSIYWMSSIFVNDNAKCGRDDLMSLLKEKNIDTRPVFPAISQYPIWNNSVQSTQQNAKLIGNSAMNLPSGVCLSYDDVKYVASTIRSLITEK